MELLNQIEVETRGGSRVFELICGDITQINQTVDLLVVSVNKRSYRPTPGSLISALQKHLAINLVELAARPSLDFRDALNCWVAWSPRRDLFRHILCTEAYEQRTIERSINQLFSNVFATIAALEAKEYRLETIAMPLLTTSWGRLDPDLVMQAMLTHSLQALEHSRVLRKIQFIDRNEERALELSDAMDLQLGRLRTRVPQGGAIQAVRNKIAERLDTAMVLAGANQAEPFYDLRSAIVAKESRQFVLGIAARKAVEFIISDLVAENSQRNIANALKQLRDQEGGPALWILYFMEVIRTLGNNSAHLGTSKRLPNTPTTADFELLLLCLLRVLDFWIERKRIEQGQTPVEANAASSSLVEDIAVDMPTEVANNGSNQTPGFL